MWCTACRQDVPGIAARRETSRPLQLCCSRCGTPLSADAPGVMGEADEATVTSGGDTPSHELPPITPLPAMDIWELEEQLRHIERILAGPRFARGLAGAAEFRLDAPQPSAQSSVTATASPPDTRDAEVARPGWWRSLLAWLLLAPGLTAMTCGAALSGWGWHNARDELCEIGLPILLAGQTALVLGLLLQLRLAWRHGRKVGGPLDADGTPAAKPMAPTTQQAERRPVA